MNSKMLRCSALLAAVPVFTVLLAFRCRGLGALPLELTVLGTLAQLAAVIFCRRSLEPLFRPAAPVLRHMGVSRVPAPYEPGRFRTDFRVTSVLMWAGLPTPALFFLAGPMARALGPAFNPWLLLIPLAMILLGSLSVSLWAKFGQAMVIANEAGENSRYLLRGFAEEVYDRSRCSHYLRTAQKFQ